MNKVHIANLREISGAIVCLNNYRQGGRGTMKKENMLKRWDDNTPTQLMSAYVEQSLELSKGECHGD
jgi:hypothetical protein